jgi:hypothetical protein
VSLSNLSIAADPSCHHNPKPLEGVRVFADNAGELTVVMRLIL